MKRHEDRARAARRKHFVRPEVEILEPRNLPSTAAGLLADAGGGAAGSFVADTDFSGGSTLPHHCRHQHRQRRQSRPAVRLSNRTLWQLHLYRSQSHPRRRLYRAARFRRNLLEQRRPAALQRLDQRPASADQFRHLRHGRRQEHRHRQDLHGYRRFVRPNRNHIHLGQGQRQGQRHRDHALVIAHAFQQYCH